MAYWTPALKSGDGRYPATTSQRPQDEFKVEVDNSNGPFRPIITYKPNALAPLDVGVEKIDKNGIPVYKHPYQAEIQHYNLDPTLLLPCQPQVPARLDQTEMTFIENVPELISMCKVIEREREIAVDLEHNSYRSFQGITCLIQISTRNHDYVIDAIKLRKELHRLNQSFTNPAIVKVFHGADNDILWLQRDFGVYVVNLFDTSRAAKVMKFAHLSLAFLMEHYCNVEAQKYYQLADWRERPLPAGMLNYARSDTHYLLYIYDRLRNDILYTLPEDSKNVTPQAQLKSVYSKGREICLKKYEKQAFSETGYMSVIKKWRYPGKFNKRQVSACQELYRWRDETSRKIDESPGYVLPNYHMMRIAQHLPVHPQSLLALCVPEPPLLKYFVMEILEIIHDVKGLSFDEDKLDPDNIYPCSGYCIQALDLDESMVRHDTAHSRDVQDSESMPVLLDKFQSTTLNSPESSDNRAMHPSSTPDTLKNSTDSYTLESDRGSRLFGFMESSNGNRRSGENRSNVDSDKQRRTSDNISKERDLSFSPSSGRNVPSQVVNRQRKPPTIERDRQNELFRSGAGEMINHNDNVRTPQSGRRQPKQQGDNSYWNRTEANFHPSNRDRVERSLQSTFISPYQRYLSTQKHQQEQQ
ncbi:Exosome component 10 [Fragariocoptes setiger]|uniref:Exosome component 10 n=1 Tax=Fragariocoptes setiger TaxID=1670756 RepID=A0ABQ7SAE8_9ACAR|nr:Exosome component 10 [Fragariocoptes setiger]